MRNILFLLAFTLCYPAWMVGLIVGANKPAELMG